jgi:protein TonB
VEKLIGDRKVYTAEQVDEPAVLAEGSSFSPSYPDSLWEAGISGTVVAEVIVDAKGMIEPGTLTIASASHPQFARMVRSALDDAVFQPGKVEGQAVRQMVQLPFRFERGDVTQAHPPSPTP